MKLDKIESVSVEISHKELEEIVLAYVYRKHAGLNSNKWNLEDFDITHHPEKTGSNERAVTLFYTHSEPVEGLFNDSKCAGSCNRCIDPYSCK